MLCGCVALLLLVAGNSAAAPPEEGAPWRLATVVLDAGDHLDLDTGAATKDGAAARASSELAVLGTEIRFLGQRRITKTFAPMVPAVSQAPWSELTTTGGRLAAVQLLHTVEPYALRYVVAPAGVTTWRRAPADPHCLGKPGGIDVWFEEDPAYVRYRVERRVGPEGAFVRQGVIEHAPFEDGAVEPRTRYGYRIYGLTAGGDESIPAQVQGTTASRGVFAGSVVFKPLYHETAKSWDLLSGQVDATGFDLLISGTFGGWTGARFCDAAGVTIRSYEEVTDADKTSAWGVPAGSRGSVETDLGAAFFVDLRGGGVARCTFRHDPDAPAEQEWKDLRIDYLVNPDGPTLGPQTHLTAARRPDGSVQIQVAGPAGATIGAIEVRDASGRVLRRLTSDGRSAIDTAPAGEVYRTYEGKAQDSKGRVHAPERALLDERPGVPQAGTFELPYRKGYDFASRSVVPIQEADLAFIHSAGGLNTVCLSAPEGIASVRTLTGWEVDDGLEVRSLFEALVSIEPTRLAWRRRDEGNGSSPPSDVFVLKCRSGGWVKLAVKRRYGPLGNSLTLDYAFNPQRPVFVGQAQVAQTTAGLDFSRAFVTGLARKLGGR